ncbi:cubilin-like [Haliotis rufescens]|uniref:cubilin-like n=1 Tax=Haliotis rufescens TaxID=6454 RepID=UPI00201EBAF6|nr:cubilin-like [Haliotis rufescens]
MYTMGRRTKMLGGVFSRQCLSVLLVLVLWGFHDAGACNETLQAEMYEKYLESAGYPTGYGSNTNCWWTIATARSGERVVVSIVDADIEVGSSNCNADSLTIYDGSSGSSAVLTTFCGTGNEQFISNGTSLYVEFKTNNLINKKGFRLRYYSAKIVTECGGTLTATPTEASLRSPSSTGAMNYLMCDWVISAENSDVAIVMEMDLFSLLESKGCWADRLSFYNGQTATESELLAHACGSSSTVFQSSGNKALMSARAHLRAFTADIFNIRYRTVNNRMCDSTVKQRDDYATYILSPGYPSNYYSNLNCAWVLETDAPRHIAMNIIYNAFDENTDCANDFVQLYDTDNANEPLGPLCGVNNSTLITRGSAMKVVFKTNAVGSGSGFRLKYMIVDHDDSYFTTQAPTATALTATSTRKYLTSPGYPTQYYNNKYYIWTITAESATSLVRIEVLTSDMEMTGDGPCVKDYISVYDGPTASSPLLKYICDSMTPTLQSTGSSLTVTFQTDDRSVDKGFRLAFYQVAGNAVITMRPPTVTSLTADSNRKNLTSPGFPDSYTNDETNIWIITATNTTRLVRIKTLQFRMQTSLGCAKDYLAFYDGSTVNDPLLKTKCTGAGETIDSTGPSITLKFSSDSRYVDEGFQLEYFSLTELELNACNGTVTASSRHKYLTTPGYPGLYSNNLDCSWTIRGVYGTRITVTVEDADIESSPRCKNDYAQVIDVADGSKELGRFCGTDKNTYVSSGLEVEIAIHSDGNTRGRGFKIMYTVGDSSSRTTSATRTTTESTNGATSQLLNGLLIAVIALIL